ncbi:MAG: anhydro-N-acetylmuramic acid kinase, partial [Geminicoccaceae bacterium]|nr:anhydro-N-acetylmuramic acid kinase [Geminicoccaceae bacterium]
DLKAMIEEAQAGSLPAAARADMALGRWFAEATAAFAEETGIAIDLVGSHGQTVCHEHGVTTLQIGEASYIAARLDCPVVADFRRADIAQGGCGAPLVPIFDEIVFGRREEAVLAINIGGIANLTFIPARAHSNAAPTAFDCGPGNMVIDRLASVRSRGARTYDENGAMAAAGRVEDALLERLMEHPFFAGDGPRSAGREQFGHAFTDELIERVAPADDRSWCDLIATATAWTARAIALSIDRADPAGGARIAHVAG